MRVEIRHRGLDVSGEVRRDIVDCLRAALGRFARAVGEARVYLRGANEPRGGAGKKCRIVLHLPPAGRVVVAGTGAGLLALVRDTADRARFAVRRHLQRRLARRRRGRRGAARPALETAGRL